MIDGGNRLECGRPGRAGHLSCGQAKEKMGPTEAGAGGTTIGDHWFVGDGTWGGGWSHDWVDGGCIPDMGNTGGGEFGERGVS